MLAVQADGHALQTVESLGTPDNMHPLQEASTKPTACSAATARPAS